VEVNDAVWEPALIEKFELRADVVWQGALAASHHDRAQEQMALVDQLHADCVASELVTPDCGLGPRGLLQPADGVSIELALKSASSRWIPSEAPAGARVQTDSLIPRPACCATRG
jgi:hypothetical protein